MSFIGVFFFFPTFAALRSGYYMLALLNFVAFLVFSHVVGIDIRHLDYPHRCRLDDFRVPLWTPFHSCIVYVLPSKGRSFDARFSRKIDSEHKLLDEMHDTLEAVDVEKKWTLKACKKAVRRIINARIHFTILDGQKDALNESAEWLYDPGNGKPVSHKLWKEAEDFCIFPIGRDVVMALMHWETLFFERRWELNLVMRQKLGKLRTLKHTGAGRFVMQTRNQHTVGDLRGIVGFEEALGYAYRVLFQKGHEWSAPLQEFQDDWLPKKSVVFDHQGERNYPKNIIEYIGRLWDECWQVDPSTFGALYLWFTVWYADIGNGRCFHTAPLQPDGDDVHMTDWRMRWRHIWHTAIICQLAILVSTTINSLVGWVSVM
jgi:hypothetical protein